eukprot:2360071-Pyramimonas_sp.AAC.1
MGHAASRSTCRALRRAQACASPSYLTASSPQVSQPGEQHRRHHTVVSLPAGYTCQQSPLYTSAH